MDTSNKRTPKLLSLLLVVCMVLSLLPTAALAAETDIPIDEAHFPDEKFRTYVLKNFDTDKNAVLSAAEAAAVTEIDVGLYDTAADTLKIHSLQGIEFFPQLTKLTCIYNQLTSLDLSKNVNLIQLDCAFNKLTSLDVSNNPNLIHLLCGHNKQLASLDVSNNPNLITLECSYGILTSLDLSNNPELDALNCDTNQLTILDVSHNPKLDELNCASNHLTSLDVSQHPNLSRFIFPLNTFTVNQRENITLPGNFDASKVFDVVGGKFDTTNNTFSFDPGVQEATYQYDVGYIGDRHPAPMPFKLIYDGPAEPETKPTEPKPTEPKPTEPKPTEPKPTEPETPKPAENPFTDVSTSQYFYAPVQWAVKNGVTSGISANKFGPNVNCTRAQIATFLWAAAGKPNPKTTKNPFVDVDESDYYYKAVLWAAENGITSGIGANKFGPNVVCTRAQAVTLLWAAEGKPVVESRTSFNDVASGDYYYNAVKWAVENKVTAGVGNNRFAPSANCLRGQIVTFLYKTFA